MITTRRLNLYPLSPRLVAALVEGDLERARSLTPHLAITDQAFAEDDHVLRLRYAQLTADPTEQPWLYRVAVIGAAAKSSDGSSFTAGRMRWKPSKSDSEQRSSTVAKPSRWRWRGV